MHRQPVDPARLDPAVIGRAADLIRAGRLVAFPTETVYGLGANALDEAAVRRVFEAKGRPPGNPLIVHVADAEAARTVVRDWTDTAHRLAADFWPGPLTLVLPRHDSVPAIVTAGLPEVAVRAPDHPVASALLRAAGVPIVAPSANPSSAVSPTTAPHVERGLGDRVDLILDAGPTALGIESTVLDLSRDPPVLLRPGALATDDIEAVIGTIRRLEGATTGPHPSPGMMERHYAPRALLLLFATGDRDRAARAARDAVDAGRTVGALLLDDLDAPVDHPVRMPADPADYARRLYAEIHRLDDAGCDLILAEQVPDGRAWDAVRDRLVRGAR